MAELWFGIVTLMLAAYVILDGFDLGAGVLHLWLARNDRERRAVLAAIGPYWDANEVWLLAAGGALFVAFPRVLSSSLAGFYLAIFLILWCLILRAIAIEFRSHVADRLWRGFWDATFAVASTLLPVLFGVAFGNVLRGVPLTPEGWFQLTLFTTFRPSEPVAILDWYTVLAGVFALVALAGHGALFLAWRTAGELGERARRAALALYAALAALWPLVTLATASVNPRLFAALPARPTAWLSLALAATGMVMVFVRSRQGRPLAAFLASCAFLGGMLAATAACLYPVMLRATGGGGTPSLSALAGGTSEVGLRTALGWWAIGIPLVVAYFAILFRIHRGKAEAATEGEGY